MATSHPKQRLFVIYFNVFFLQIQIELSDKKPAVCKAFLNVSFYYVSDDTDSDWHWFGYSKTIK